MDKSLNNTVELKRKLSDIKQQIRRDWKEYKLSRLCLHGEGTADNRLDMLLVHLIKKGIL